MELLQNIVYAIIAAVVPILTKFVCDWLKSMFEANKEKIQNDKIRLVVENVTDMVASAVVTTTSTYVKSLKAENIFDEAAQKEAFNKTKDAVMAQITTESADIIEYAYGNLDIFIDNLIERYVEELKDNKKDNK